MNAAPPEAARTRRGRRTLLILVAAVLGALGLKPSSTRNKGEWLKPYADLRALSPALADGGEYRWNPELRQWRVAVAAPPACTARCVEVAAQLDTVRQLLGREAGRLQVLWIGELPAGVRVPAHLHRLRADAELLDKLPRSREAVDAPVLYVVDPYGFVVLRYAPGFDPADLRYDLAKLLKLE